MARFPARPATAGARRALAALFASLTLAASAVLAPGTADAAPADLDPSFGGDGIVLTSRPDSNESLNDMVIQPDGRIVAVGSTDLGGTSDFYITRYLSNGSLDKSLLFFDSGGETAVDFQAGWHDFAHAVTTLPDGRILAAGESGNGSTTRWALARLNANGSADTTLAGKGTTLGPALLNLRQRATAVAVDPQGRILVAGNFDNGDGNQQWFVTRLSPGGAFDQTFGPLGTTEIDPTAEKGPESVTGIALHNGRILLAGTIKSGDFAVARLTEAGDLDPGFGVGGIVRTPIGEGVDAAEDIALQPDGRIVVAGWNGAAPARFAVARYLANGTPDPSFGTGGKTMAALTTKGAHATSVAIGPGGKLLVAGKAVSDAFDSDLALARFNPNGSLDLGFGNAGSIITPVSAGNDATSAIGVQADGRIVLAGTSMSDGNPDAMLVRYLGAASGYWTLDSSGKVYLFGDARHFGDGNPDSVDIEPSPTRDGYWTLDSAGRVLGHNVSFVGDDPSLAAGERAVSISATPSGAGYWIFTDRGRVFSFGDAKHHGDMSGTKLNGPVLDSIATPDGNGYYMVASDGGVFAFPDGVTKFYGSMGNTKLNKPVQSLVPDPDGVGYWLVASDGGVFAFEAPFRGSMGGKPLNDPVSGMVPYGNGYLMVATDGGVFVFSNLDFEGSKGDDPPAHPMIAVAAL